MRKQLLSIATAAAVLSGLTAVPAVAHNYPVEYGYTTRDTDTVAHNRDYRRYDDRRYDRHYGRYDDRRYDNRRYDGYDNRYNNRHYRHRGNRCDSGTGGTIIGGIVGALAGHEIAGRGDRTAGTIIGGAVGAIGGRAIDRSNDGCR